MDGTSTWKSRGFRPPTWLTVVAFAALGGCSTYIGTTSKSFLRQVRTNPDPNIRYIAYAKLGAPDLFDDPADKSEAVETLVTKLQEGREPLAVRAVIIRSLGNLGDRRARNAIARVANDSNVEPVIKVEACRALGKVGSPEDATILARIMTVDNLEDCRIAAIEGLGSLKANDPRIFRILIEGMDHEDPALRLACYRALRQITGKDLGPDPAAWRRELEPEPASTGQPGGTPPRSEPAPSKPRQTP
jgi:HEAT repeat protein